MTGIVRINGRVSEGSIPVTDSSVLRGDGCYETLRSYGGRPFALDRHLDRLQRSATKMQLMLPERSDLEDWIRAASAEGGDCAVRILVTRGSALPDDPGEPKVIVFSHTWPLNKEPARFMMVTAPWHSAGHDWALAGAKYLSYAPNMSAGRAARAAGFDDAVLNTVDGLVLEGTTFSVAWVVEGVLETPTLELGILDSITRGLVLEMADEVGLPISVGRFPVSRLERASEVMAISTIREVQPVIQLGDKEYPAGEITRSLARAFDQLVGSTGS